MASGDGVNKKVRFDAGFALGHGSHFIMESYNRESTVKDVTLITHVQVMTW